MRVVEYKIGTFHDWANNTKGEPGPVNNCGHNYIIWVMNVKKPAMLPNTQGIDLLELNNNKRHLQSNWMNPYQIEWTFSKFALSTLNSGGLKRHHVNPSQLLSLKIPIKIKTIILLTCTFVNLKNVTWQITFASVTKIWMTNATLPKIRDQSGTKYFDSAPSVFKLDKSPNQTTAIYWYKTINNLLKSYNNPKIWLLKQVHLLRY